MMKNLLGAIQVGGTLIASPLLRGWYNRWGATQAELQQALPGDELVPNPQLGYTRAITIHAPVKKTWPWLAQLGQGRGGFYSYDGLENLIGCNIHSVEQINPEWQDPQPGGLIRMGPAGYPSFAIVSIDPPHALVLVSADPQTGQPVTWADQKDKGYSIATWQFALQPGDAGATRLLVRQRLSYSSDLSLPWRLTEPVSFVMERQMLLGIRQRAERPG